MRARPFGPRWLPVVTVVVGMGLVLAGADLVVWRTREPAVTSKPRAPLLTLVKGTLSTLVVPGVVRVAVGASGIVNVTVVGEDTPRLEPLAVGTITMLVWTRDGSRRVYTVSVLPH